MSKLGLQLLSTFALLLSNGSHGFPAELHHQDSQKPDESRLALSTFSSGFVPLVPSQLDPHPTLNVNTDSHLRPVFAEEKFFPSFFRSSLKLPSARPFVRHQGSSSSSGLYQPTPKPQLSLLDESVLGSGDFVVLRGGTFYPEGESQHRPTHDYFGSGSSFVESADHGRPFALPLESSHYSDDPFANFKDFADITAGIDTDFSHVVPVYVNKENSTIVKHEPNNILDQLEMIDEEKRNEQQNRKSEEVSTPKPIKASKFKSKLLRTKLTKAPKKKEKPKKVSSLDYIDPLVADS